MAQSSKPRLKVGTRGSALALAQARELAAQLLARQQWEADAVELKIIRTSGDVVQDRPLVELGGKGLFTKEIEDALLSGSIDVAVHSAKDLPAALPAGLLLAGCLKREDPRDAFISEKAETLAELAANSLLGTASPRRQALVRRVRPDLRLTALRGNVDTRLRKLRASEIDAMVLALAGLKRLGLEEAAQSILPIEVFVPAVGQGVIAIEARATDRRVRELVESINDPETASAIAAERAFLTELGGSCRTPIAGYAWLVEGSLVFRGMVLKADGSDVRETTRRGAADQAVALGADAGRELQARLPAGFW